MNYLVAYSPCGWLHLTFTYLMLETVTLIKKFSGVFENMECVSQWKFFSVQRSFYAKNNNKISYKKIFSVPVVGEFSQFPEKN